MGVWEYGSMGVNRDQRAEGKLRDSGIEELRNQRTEVRK
jgi:hypothetical protein